jgi:hypothetical protein
VIIWPINFTEFQQPKNISEIFKGLDDIGEVNLPIVDKHLFDNIALASIYPHTESPAPIIRAVISSELNSSFFRLVQCTQASALVVFRTPHTFTIATNISQIDIEWGDVSYVVSLLPRDMTDNKICLDQGYLVNLEILDFPVEYWCKDIIAATFYPYGSVIIIEQLCLTGFDFSAISLCLNIRQARLPRRILINEGPEGILFKVRIKGFINHNNSSQPPSPPVSNPPTVPNHNNYLHNNQNPSVGHPIAQQVSYPIPRKRERSLHTCAQDVQITRMATI